MATGGLTTIYPPAKSNEGVDNLDFQLDIIFVHGLNPKASQNHGRQTWTHASKIFWPGDILPNLLPKARVLLFEYNSRVAGFGAVNLGINDHADSLLDSYRALRIASSNLPTIFICHSLGGLVVKQALVRAILRSPNDPGMRNIKDKTYGLVFFGTPHRGGNAVSVGEVVEKVVKTFSVGGNNSLLQCLKRGGKLSVDAQDNFRSHIEDFQYISVIEGRPKPGVGIVVPRESGTLGADVRRETVISIDADHSKMCKFDSDSGIFTPIKHYLVQMASRAVQESLNGSKANANLGSRSNLELASVDQSSHDDLRILRSKTSKHLDDETTLQCFASLTASHQSHKLSQHMSQITPGTCAWILTHPTYIEWAESRSPELLWISGLPGYGKTTLVSFLISELRKSGHIVLYFFCDKSDSGSGGNLIAILQSLVLQLAQIQIREQDEVPSVLLRTFRMRKFQTDQQLSGFSWTWSDLWAVLTEMLWQLGPGVKVAIFIDALDECDEETKTAKHCVSTLLSSLMGEQVPPTNTPIKAVVTCRQVDSSINDSYDKSSVWHKAFEITPQLTKDDMKTVVKSKVAKLRQAKGISERNARKLEESILQHSKGMFLWVSLTTSQLRTSRFNSNMIGSMFLPLGLNQLYQTILEESDVSRVEDTRLILSAIACSIRPLKFQELLSLLESYSGSRWDGLRGDLSFLCGPLVAIQDNDVLHLAHESLRTFLISYDLEFPKGQTEKAPFIDVMKAESLMASACLSYLQKHYEKVPSRKTNYRAKIDALMSSYPLLEYAYGSWNYHMSRADPAQVEWQDLLDQTELMETMYQVSYYLRLPMSRDIPWLPEQLDPLHLASFFGITWLVKLLLNDSVMPNRVDENESRGIPLILAAENENYSCMEALLLHGADPNFQEKQGWTALHWTAANGQLLAAGLLVAKGANVLLKDSRGYDAEHYAAKSGNWGVVSLLRRKVRQLVHQGLTNYESHSGSDSDVVQSAAQRLSNLKLDSVDLGGENTGPAAPSHIKSLESRLKTECTSELQDIVIAVMGVTGVGKSSFINRCTGYRYDIRVGHALSSQTDKIESYNFSLDGFNVTLVDTLGFDDTVRSDVDTLCDLARWLEETYTKGFLLTGIIHLHSINSTRMYGSALRQLRMFRRLCGKDALSNVLLVTTMWDTVRPEVGTEREESLRTEYWSTMLARESRMFRHTGDEESALAVVRALLPKPKIVLQIQREMVDERKALADTAAGAVVLESLDAVTQKHQEDLLALRREMANALQMKDGELQREIRDVEGRLREDLITRTKLVSSRGSGAKSGPYSTK
ncbi:hypothetical protein IFR05_000556 [Cadophora sp. M221]|nr:hypothetical protein IFR05_000556 [Cadophora sp. M221]